jgi:colicin import membrane protein
MIMSRTGVTHEDVSAVYISLQKQGTRPTASLIRDRLGRGSITTIHGHLVALREQDQADPLDALLPVELQKPLKQFLAKHASQVRLDTEAELMEIREESAALAAENRTLQEAVDGAQQQLADLTAQLAQAQDALKHLGAEKARLAQKLAEARERADSNQLESTKATAVRDSLERNFDKAQERIKTLKVELAEARDARQAAEQGQAVAETARAGMEQRLADQQVRLERMESENQNLRADQTRLRDGQQEAIRQVRAEVGEQISLCREMLSVIQAQQPGTTTTLADASEPASASPPATQGTLTRNRAPTAPVDAPSSKESTAPNSADPNAPPAKPAAAPETPQGKITTVAGKEHSPSVPGKKGFRSSKSNRKPPGKTLRQTNLFDNDLE